MDSEHDDKDILIESMARLFGERDKEDVLFTHLRTSEWKVDIREYFGRLLIDSKKWGGVDDHFHNGFSLMLVQRWWELYMGKVLVTNFNDEVCSSSIGPDFLIKHKIGPVYIECIAPEASKGGPNIRNRQSGIGYLNDSSALLRLTAAIKEKAIKYKQYLDKKIIEEDSYTIICVNMMEVPDIDLMETSGMPFILRALVGVGDYVMKIPVFNQDGSFVEKEKQTPSVVPSYIAEISNKNGSSIELCKFLNNDYEHISAVVFSYDRYLEMPILPQKWSMLHNPKAKKKLPLGFWRGVGKEFYCTETHVHLYEK